ncbi:aquaporin-11-like [Anneissia japonica]|uniref:aquaporin-11-like n=1 Tax=Anneissia japonica TaxID=1529436 RepID=UPI001425AD4F|nr:aquaporin-11-like [Anneissia japonica]XP_033104099.1 aquaporin-11-like [Anneissia japonica]XP_033104100.1 aquaporin-11-like [Anneissia japonica]
MAIAISVASFIGIFIISYLLRKVLRSCLPRNIYQYIAESLCTFQLVACVYENSIIFSGYNIGVYSVVLFVLIFAYSLTFDASGNPARVFETMIKRQCSIIEGILKIALQVIGGLLAYRYVILVWKFLAPTELHTTQVEILDVSCDNPLKVSIVEGIIAEMLATSTARSIAGMGLGGRRFYKAVNAFTAVVVTLTGMEWTGMMFNPALATSLAYNCKNHPIHEHILVYWCGPFLGVLMSMFIFHFILDEIIVDEDENIKQVDVVETNFKVRNGKRSMKRFSSG